jgi:hypothetical protein
MNTRGTTPKVWLLIVVAVLCLLLSLVVQLGESIRYQSTVPGSKSYTVKELVLILGAPSVALISLTLACIFSRWRLLIALAIPLAALSLYHIYLALTRL